MSSLSVYHVSSPDLPNKVLTHFDDITDPGRTGGQVRPLASDGEAATGRQR